MYILILKAVFDRSTKKVYLQYIYYKPLKVKSLPLG